MSASGGENPSISESSAERSGSNFTPSDPAPPGTPRTTPNNQGCLSKTPRGEPPSTAVRIEVPQGHPDANQERTTSAEANPPTHDEALPPSKKRLAPSVPVENEKSMRTEEVHNAPPLKPKDAPVKAPPGTHLRRAAQRANSRRGRGNTRSPSAQPSPSHSQGPSQSVPFSGNQPAANGRGSVSGGQAPLPQYAHPLAQVSFPLAQVPYQMAPMQPMQGLVFQPLQQSQQFAQQQFAQQPLLQQSQQQLAALPFQQLLQQFAQQSPQQFQQFAQQPPQQLQQFVQQPAQQLQQQQFAQQPAQQLQQQQLVQPPPPDRPVLRDPRRRRGRVGVIEEDDSMGEQSENTTFERDEELYAKSQSELEQEAYDGEAEEEEEEEEDEFDEDLERFIESTYEDDERAAGSDAAEENSHAGHKQKQLGDGELTYYIVDQLNEMREENRVHNDALINRMDKMDKRIARIEYGSSNPTVQVRKKLKTSNRAPKPSRSKHSRIELPPPPDGKPRTATQMETLMGVELEYLNRAQKVVRMHFKKLLRVKSFEQMAEKCPPLAEAELAAYNKWPNDKEYFAPNNFRVDFSRPWATHPFNIDARDYFIRHLQHALGGGAYRQEKFFFPERYRTEYHLGAALDAHMEHCRARVRRINNPLSSDAEEEEKRKARARARRGTLHAIRVGVVVDCDYDEHLDLMTKLTPVNHSEDETDVDMPRRRTRANRFRIIACDWMSDGLRNFLRALYAQYIDEWETSPTRRTVGGSAPRERVTTTPPMSELGHAAIGLWRNCYNEAWLATLKRHELRSLCIIDSDYDFTIRPRPTQ